MLFSNPSTCCRNYFVICLILWGIAGYVYSVNSRLPDDDPKKRNYHPAAVFLAPLTLPLFAAGYISLLIIKAFLYGLFLVTFTILIIIVRKPFVIEWLKKIINFIGRVLLGANTILIRLLTGERLFNPPRPI